MARQKRRTKQLTVRRTTRATGIQGGRYTMETSFKDQDQPWFDDVRRHVVRTYRKGCYSQRAIADAYGLSTGIVSKMVRCDDRAPRRGQK